MADASRVVLGLGGCVDYELKLTADVLEQLVAEYGIVAAELTSPATVTGERDLVVSDPRVRVRGGGGEHFVASAAALQTFAGRSRTAPLGGTSVRAGHRDEPARCAVHPAPGQRQRHRTPAAAAGARLRTPARVEDTFYPHLIVQYDQGLRIRTGEPRHHRAVPEPADLRQRPGQRRDGAHRRRWATRLSRRSVPDLGTSTPCATGA
jgi:ADP-dependent phosphofructokinase/glucokinase